MGTGMGMRKQRIRQGKHGDDKVTVQKKKTRGGRGHGARELKAWLCVACRHRRAIIVAATSHIGDALTGMASGRTECSAATHAAGNQTGLMAGVRRMALDSHLEDKMVEWVVSLLCDTARWRGCMLLHMFRVVAPPPPLPKKSKGSTVPPPASSPAL
ncbi:unnamed protein product [Diplocarpon coronariae]